MKKILILTMVTILALALTACAMPEKETFTITYDLGSIAEHFTYAPTKAKAGDSVELKTEILIDADIHVYVDGKELEKSHYDSDYWGYSFIMPEKDLLVTARFYTKGEIWGVGD